MLPVYRTSERVEKLQHNYRTFEACQEIFEQNGIVIIFSEGRCINEWHLRQIKKGTARLATSAWLQGTDLTVLPVGLNYNTFRNFGKNVIINFGEPLDRENILEHGSDGKMFLSFNEQLRERLAPLVFEIDPGNKNAIREKLYISQSTLKKVLLAGPVMLGFVLHAPLYFALKTINGYYFNNDHFDSTLVALLFLSYPFYVLALLFVTALLFGWMIAAIIFLLMPFFAWSCVQLKSQI